MKRFLLDTNIVIRWLYEPTAIPDRVLAPIRDSAATAMYSAVTPYELTLKSSLGKLGIDVSDLIDRLADARIVELPLRAVHAVEAGRLPLFHRDPFDRLLVAQARVENCTLVTTDAQLSAFDVTIQRVPR